MSHADLVKVARRWLKNTQRCGIVFTEHHGGTIEIPDAIGFRWTRSIQVECKVSVADFKRDARKSGRGTLTTSQQASERWYLAPTGLLANETIPENWGLLEYDGKRVSVARPMLVPPVVDDNIRRNEVSRLYCEIRRYQSQGITYRTVSELLAEEKAQRESRRMKPVPSDAQGGGK